MAYPSSASNDNTNAFLLIGGIGVVGYLWWKGYLASWFPTTIGAQIPTSPTTSVSSGAILPTLSQVATPSNVQSVLPSAPPRIVHPQAPILHPGTGIPGIDQSTLDLANESYYTWRASGEPLSVLAQINAAFQDVEDKYSVVPTPQHASVVSGSVVPTLTQISSGTPATHLSAPQASALNADLMAKNWEMFNANVARYADQNAAMQNPTSVSVVANAPTVTTIAHPGDSGLPRR